MFMQVLRDVIKNTWKFQPRACIITLLFKTCQSIHEEEGQREKEEVKKK